MRCNLIHGLDLTTKFILGNASFQFHCWSKKTVLNGEWVNQEVELLGNLKTFEVVLDIGALPVIISLTCPPISSLIFLKTIESQHPLTQVLLACRPCILVVTALLINHALHPVAWANASLNFL